MRMVTLHVFELFFRPNAAHQPLVCAADVTLFGVKIQKLH